MRAYLLAFATVVVLVLGGVMAANAIVDPTGIVGTGMMPPVVWTARGQKLDLYHELSEPPATLVVGSSRSMKLPTDALEELFGAPAFNFAVASARTEDLLGIYLHVRDTAELQTLVIGLDLESLSDIRPDARLLAQPELRTTVPLWRRTSARLEDFAELSSLSNLFLTLRSIRGGPRTSRTSYDEQGFLTYIDREQQIAEGRYDLDAAIRRSIGEYRRRFAAFDELSPWRIEQLERLVRTARADGVRVFLFVTPLHPDVIDVLREHHDYDRIHADVVDIVTSLAEEPGVCALDAGSIEAFGGDPALFYDGAHPREENNRRLLSTLAAEADCAVQ